MKPVPHRGTFPGDNFKEYPKFAPREGVPTRYWWMRKLKPLRNMAQVMADEQRHREEWRRLYDEERRKP